MGENDQVSGHVYIDSTIFISMSRIFFFFFFFAWGGGK